MDEYIENIGNKIGNFLRIIIGVYIVFCIMTFGYFFLTLQRIPDDCSFFSFSAHIGVMALMVIFMLLMICT